MGDYERGYDLKYGYNRNAFAHKAPLQHIMHLTVKLIATPLGLASEAIHHQSEKKKRSVSCKDVSSPSERVPEKSEGATDNEVTSPTGSIGSSPPPVYVNVTEDQANELIKTHQAVPANSKAATHELVSEGWKDGDVDRDEADWALDEAASVSEDGSKSDEQSGSIDEECREEIRDQVKFPTTFETGQQLDTRPSKRLLYPVILPQRRPGTKARGFVRAYAPVLESAGIDQEMFLNFLKDFHKAAQASPIFEVIMIATAIAGAYPDIMISLALQAVYIAAGVGQEIQERWRTNKFLDQANRDIFIPKGLFALIVTYKSGNSEQTEIGTKTVDLGASAIAKYGDAVVSSDKTETEGGGASKMAEVRAKMRQLRVSSGETHGEAEIPVTCAPLIFPALDAAADAPKKGTATTESAVDSIKARSKSASKFVSDYLDRRAQASYVSLY